MEDFKKSIYPVIKESEPFNREIVSDEVENSEGTEVDTTGIPEEKEFGLSKNPQQTLTPKHIQLLMEYLPLTETGKLMYEIVYDTDLLTWGIKNHFLSMKPEVFRKLDIAAKINRVRALKSDLKIAADKAGIKLNWRGYFAKLESLGITERFPQELEFPPKPTPFGGYNKK